MAHFAKRRSAFCIVVVKSRSLLVAVVYNDKHRYKMALVFSERLFYVIIVLILSITAIIVPIIILKEKELGVNFIFIGPKGFGETSSTKAQPKQKIHTLKTGKWTKRPKPSDYDDDEDKTKPENDGVDMVSGSSVNDYLSDSDLEAYFDNLVKKNARFMKKENGPKQTLQGRNLYLVKLEDPKYDPKRKTILFISGIAGCDWRAPLLTIFVVNYFLNAREQTNQVLKDFNLHFIPLLNPDGYNFTRSSTPLNRSYPFNANGINLISDYATESKQPETDFFNKYFQKNKNIIRIIILFESLQSSITGTSEHRICLPQQLEQKRNESFIFFTHWHSTTQICVEKNMSHLSNWVVTETSKNPILVFSNQVDYKPQATPDNLNFIQSNGMFVYDFVIDLINLAKEAKATNDHLGMKGR